MRQLILSLGCTILLCTCVSLNPIQAQRFAVPDTQQVTVDVVFLAADLLEGRLTGTPGEQLAANYISQRMQQIGLAHQPGTRAYQQVFDFEYKDNPHAAKSRKLKGINVVGYLDNYVEETIIIGAHYDHLGYGGIGSLHTGDPAVHNGADDNASGIAAMLNLAEKLMRKGAPRTHNFLFIAFSGEELGLIGSKKWVAANPDFPAAAMFNMDMVGRLKFKDHVLAVHGVGTSPVWGTALDLADAETPITSHRDSSGMGPSDQASFYLDSIPVLSFFTGQHTDYHKPSDDAEKIDFVGITEISQYLFTILQSVAEAESIPFLATRQKASREASSFKVTLGIMPDYVYSGEGMKIDGVIDDRPAAKAGIKAGDVLIKIGDLEVKDIYDYMEGLGQHEVGDQTEVTVRRGQDILALPVTF